MKKLFLAASIIFSIVFFSCTDSTTDPTTPTNDTGSVFVQSSPSGAQIWIEGTNSNKLTPDTVTNLSVGSKNVKLVFVGTSLRDTTVQTNITKNGVASLNITAALDTALFGPVRIWETADNTSGHYSGLMLSSGQPLSVAGSNKQSTDIYYSSTGYIVASANKNTTQGLTRKTYFKVGASNNLYDGLTSSLFQLTDSNWKDNIPVTETNYAFLYDNDGYYSKARITGQGTAPYAWVEITWVYNKVKGDKRFK
ncbi:MAG: hypothetical protein WC209_04085 [Ignavibacteriaceae bacterium]|jgi:hypothetical protein